MRRDLHLRAPFRSMAQLLPDLARQLHQLLLGMCLVRVRSAPSRRRTPKWVFLHCSFRTLCLCLAVCAFLIARPGYSQSGGIYSLGISDNAKVRFTWRSNSEPDLAGYRIYVGTVSGVYANFVDAGRATTFDLPNLLRGMTYYFTLTAYNTSGLESACTDELTCQIPLLPPTVPQPQSAAPQESELLLDSPPAISTIPDQWLSKNRPSDPISFTVYDTETPPAELQFTAYSSNPLVLPSSALILAGTDIDRTLIIDPVNGQTGISLVTLAVSDGSSTTTISFLVAVDHETE